MRKRDWLLLVIGSRIEPIQLQKALFKFREESGVSDDEAYRFVPYNWGPCSFEVYDDIGVLREEGLVEAVPTGRGWSVYRLTNEGEGAVKRLTKGASQALVEQLHGVRQWVVSRDFGSLLRDVYSEYPKYATQSMFTQK